MTSKRRSRLPTRWWCSTRAAWSRWGRRRKLYEQPRTPFVTSFLGAVNVLRGQAASGTAVLGEGIHVPTEIDGHDVPVTVYVRPHDFDLAREHMLEAVLAGARRRGSSHRWGRSCGSVSISPKGTRSGWS